MVIIQLIAGLIIPVIMILTGRTIRKKADSYLASGLAYRLKSALLTPESWNYTNRFFGTMLVAIGANMTVITLIIILAAVLAAGVNGWWLVLFFACFEAFSVLLFVFLTEFMEGKLFDEKGQPLISGFDKDYEDEEDEGEADGE